MTRFRLRLHDLRTSYWFLPAVFSFAAVLAAFILSMVDASTPNFRAEVGELQTVSLAPANTAALFNSMATTAISVIGVVFTVALVPLTIASSQYGSIVLRRFLRDRGIQTVLATYCATIAFAITAGLLLPEPLNKSNAPQISLLVGSVLFLVSLALLVYFIHHIAWSLQASNVIAALGNELEQAIVNSLPLRTDMDADDPPAASEVEAAIAEVCSSGLAISARRSGYVRAIALEDVIGMASGRNLVMVLNRQPGDYVVAGDTLGWVSPKQRIDLRTRIIVRTSYLLGEQRTMLQDLEFGLSLPAVVAVRALSPAINDPFTAMAAIDRLATALSLLAEREQPSPYRRDDQGEVRLIVRPPSFERYLDVAFDVIRQYGRSSVIVLLRLLAAIDSIALHAHHADQQHALLKHANLVLQDCHIGLQSPWEKESVRQAYETTVRLLQARLKSS